ncbi:MAG TPA: hypothetical protein V6C81_26915 [Planktothrix sp.]|jgi:hypothetical protein
MAFASNNNKIGQLYELFKANSLQIRFSPIADIACFAAAFTLNTLALYLTNRYGATALSLAESVGTALTFSAWYWLTSRGLAMLLRQHRENDTVFKSEPIWQMLFAIALWVLVPLAGSIAFIHNVDKGGQLFAVMLLSAILTGNLGLQRFFKLPGRAEPYSTMYCNRLDSLTEREPAPVAVK